MMIKSISSTLGLCVCTALLSSNIFAATIVNQTTGLDSPDIVIDFGINQFEPGTVITDDFLGVTFGNTYTYNNYNEEARPALTDGYLENNNTSTDPDPIFSPFPPGSISFSVDVTAAVFSWRTIQNTTTTFTAYNDGILVESIVDAITNTSLTGGRYYGFEDILFDEIRLSIAHSNQAFTLDNLQYISAVPVPAAVWLFGSGLLGLVGVARRKR